MDNGTIALVFSPRKGNCYDFACQIVSKDRILLLGMMDIQTCHACKYECMNARCCPIVETVFRTWNRSRSIIMFVPVYDGRPPALFYALLERLPGFWLRE